MNLPNKITLARICLIPLFVVVFYLDVFSGRPYQYLIACIIFALAACTDFLDGHIARSRHLVTNMGKFLDPIADKVLVSTALIVMLTRPVAFEMKPFYDVGLIFAGICVALIIAREFIVSGFRMIAAGKNMVLAADKLGKLKTVVQDVSIGCLLGASTFTDWWFGRVVLYAGLAGFVLCTVLTIASGANYIVRNRQILHDETDQADQ